jgi:hypothetical protein
MCLARYGSLCLRKSETNSVLAEDSSRQGYATEAAAVAELVVNSGIVRRGELVVHG